MKISEEVCDEMRRRFTGFVLREAWPEYTLVDSISSFLKPRNVHGWVRYGLWPIIFYVHIGDSLPPLFPKKRYFLPHFFVWDTIFDSTKKQGWFRMGKNARLRIGVQKIVDDLYYESWSKNARISRRNWLTLNDDYLIQETESDSFLHEYKKSDTYKSIEKYTADKIVLGVQKREKAGTLTLKYLFIIHKKNNEIMAGLMYESSPSTANTYYSIGFLKKYESKNIFMTGLLIEWIEREKKNEKIFFNYGAFWKRGFPSSWKGFSLFKQKYGVEIIDLPASYITIKWFW